MISLYFSQNATSLACHSRSDTGPLRAQAPLLPFPYMFLTPGCSQACRLKFPLGAEWSCALCNCTYYSLIWNASPPWPLLHFTLSSVSFTSYLNCHCLGKPVLVLPRREEMALATRFIAPWGSSDKEYLSWWFYLRAASLSRGQDLISVSSETYYRCSMIFTDEMNEPSFKIGVAKPWEFYEIEGLREVLVWGWANHQWHLKELS